MSPDTKGKVYVAGHRGLVGSAIVRELRAQGFENLLLRTHAELDLLDQGAVARFFQAERPDYVFLAAAKVGGIHANNIYRGDFIYQNLVIQTNIMHQAKEAGVKRLLFLGSSCIYPKHAPQPMREEHLLTGPLEPTNSPYAVAKIAGIEMCHAYNAQYGTSFVPVMPTNLYGPGDNYDLETSHVLPAMMRKFHLARLAGQGDWEAVTADEAVFGTIPRHYKEALGLPPAATGNGTVVLWGTGTPRREFLHVDDLAAACVYIVFKTHTTSLLNIGVGEDVSIRELAELVARTVGYDGPVRWDAEKPDGTPQKLLDVSRVSELGWRPSIDLEEGVRQTYAGYLSAVGTTPRRGKKAPHGG